MSADKPTTDQTRGPADRCVCGDLYWRHGNGDDGQAPSAGESVSTGTVITKLSSRDHDGPTFTRCDCAGFELAEDDL